MNPLIELKKTAPLLLITLTLHCFALLPQAPAVVPPPDGGYPGFNTAEGQNALFSLTTGSANTAVGWYSLFSNTDGSFNTGVGAGTLLFNIGNQTTGEGLENTAVGAVALLNNTTGNVNTAVGTAALLNNTEGNQNTATGHSALHDNTTGDRNTAVGDNALFSNTIGGSNTATGRNALAFNINGNENTANGVSALVSNIDGNANTASGVSALNMNTTGDFNTANGNTALALNTTGNFNTANGVEALFSNTIGNGNTANGYQALQLNATATGNFNTAIGYQALLNNTTGAGNTALGVLAGSGVGTADNVICIGATGANVSNSCYINHIFGATSSQGTAVFINSDGKLGTTTSSRRFKNEIKPMGEASGALFALKPVTFHYKKEIDPASTSQFGLLAEEVEEMNPDLVVRDKEGKPYSVRYDAVNAMLLNEFLKEHRKVEKLEATVAQQRKDFETAVAQLTAQVQKVSAQLEASKPAPQVVNNP